MQLWLGCTLIWIHVRNGLLKTINLWSGAEVKPWVLFWFLQLVYISIKRCPGTGWQVIKFSWEMVNNPLKPAAPPPPAVPVLPTAGAGRRVLLKTFCQIFLQLTGPFFGAQFLSTKVKNTDIKLAACQQAVWSTESQRRLSGKGSSCQWCPHLHMSVCKRATFAFWSAWCLYPWIFGCWKEVWGFIDHLGKWTQHLAFKGNSRCRFFFFLKARDFSECSWGCGNNVKERK